MADVAHALLKVSSYDAITMACRGLQQYMTVLMPNGDWSQEPMKQVLNTLFRRVINVISINLMKGGIKLDSFHFV